MSTWWIWVTLLVVGFLALAAGFGLFLIIMVGLAWVAVTLIRESLPGGSDDDDPREILDQSQHEMHAMLADASNEVLCELWSQTRQELTRAYLPSTIMSYAELRQSILDELTRRDPDGVRRWLGEQPYCRDPRRYLQDQPR